MKINSWETYIRSFQLHSKREIDYDVKMRSIVRFIEDGDKVKVTMRFRGREMAHQEIGMHVLERVRADLGESAKVEQFPRMEGRLMVMVMAPK